MARKSGPRQITFTEDAERWWMSLSAKDADRVANLIGLLEREGPNLGGEQVKLIRSSQHHNMKELRPTAAIRALFAFDKDGTAVFLLGGDKTGNWKRWYGPAVKGADQLYDQHRRNEGKETPWRELRNRGERSAASGR